MELWTRRRVCIPWLFFGIILSLVTSSSIAYPDELALPPSESKRAAILKTWENGLDDTRYSRMAFLFEVTFMNIDVANIEACFSTAVAGIFETLVISGKSTDERIHQVATAAINADPCAFRFTFCRDGGSDRFMKGMQKGLEAAREDNLISEPELALVWDWVRPNLATLEERGLKEKDQLLFRLVGNEVHMIFLGANDTLIFDTINSSPGCARGIKGIFLADESKFKEELIQSLWPD